MKCRMPNCQDTFRLYNILKISLSLLLLFLSYVHFISVPFVHRRSKMCSHHQVKMTFGRGINGVYPPGLRHRVTLCALIINHIHRRDRSIRSVFLNIIVRWEDSVVRITSEVFKTRKLGTQPLQGKLALRYISGIHCYR